MKFLYKTSAHFFSKLFTLICLIYFFIPVLHGQEGGSTSDTSNQIIPKPFELIELGEKLNEANTDYGEITERIKNGIKILEIDTLLDKFITKLEREKSDYQTFRQISPNRQKLDNMIKRWKSFEERLNQWHSTIDAYQIKSKDEKEQLIFDLEVWNLTIERAEEEEAPEVVKDDLRVTAFKLDSFITELTERDAAILEIESKLAARKIEAGNIAEDLEKWFQSGELNIFYLRHNPIWNTSFRSSGISLRGTSNIHWKNRLREIKEYFESYSNRLNLFFLGVLIIFGITIFLRYPWSKRLDANLTNLGTNYFELLKKKFWVVAIFLSLIWGVYFFRNLPELLGEVFVISLLIMTFAMFFNRMSGKFKLLIPAIIVVFILDMSKSYLWFTSSNYRLYMYFECLFGLGFLLYFIRPKNLGLNRPLGRVEYSLLRISYVLVAFFLIAFLSNTLGYTNLTDLTLKISVFTAIIGTIAYGLRLSLNAIFSVMVMKYFDSEKGDFDVVKNFLKNVDSYIRGITLIFWVGFLITSTDLHILIGSSLGPWYNEPIIIGNYSITPKSVFSFIAVLIISYLLTKIISSAFDRDLIRIFNIKKGWPGIVSMLLRYFVIGLAIFTSMGVLGIDVKNFTLVAGALGLGIGFGLKEIVSNFIAGIILAFEQPMKTGDVIEVGSISGIVGKIGIRSSKVRSYDGADISVPNNNLLSNELVNWTYQDNIKRLDLRIGTEYGSDPNKVLEVLKEVAGSHPLTQIEPAPLALFEDFGDSSLNFRLLFWVPVDSALSAKSQVYVEIYNRLNQEGIGIPFPRQDINIITDGRDDQ